MKYHNRGFLNKTGGMAAFEADVHFEPSESPYISAGFSISDCFRQITLDFDVSCYNVNEYENVSHKLTTLILELIVFEKKLMQAKVEFDIARANNEANE